MSHRDVTNRSKSGAFRRQQTQAPAFNAALRNHNNIRVYPLHHALDLLDLSHTDQRAKRLQTLRFELQRNKSKVPRQVRDLGKRATEPVVPFVKDGGYSEAVPLTQAANGLQSHRFVTAKLSGIAVKQN